MSSPSGRPPNSRHPGVYRTFADLLAHKSAVLSGIRSQFAPWSTESLNRVEPGGWSATQVLEHLVIVERGMLAIAEKLLGRAAPAGASAFHVDVSGKVAAYTGRAVKTKERFEPRGGMSARECLEELGRLEAALCGLAERLGAIDPASASFPHWELGPLTLAEWLAFLVVHEERHVAQIGRALSA